MSQTNGGPTPQNDKSDYEKQLEMYKKQLEEKLKKLEHIYIDTQVLINKNAGYYGEVLYSTSPLFKI